MSLGPIDICFSCDLGQCHKCTGKTMMGHICQHGCCVTEFVFKHRIIAYLKLWDFLDLIDDSENRLRKLTTDYYDIMMKAQGSSHNHQAWEGGYLDHVVETLNIGAQLYDTLSKLRPLPFKVKDVLQVMFLHDIEKPFKDNPDVETPLGISWKKYCDEAEAKWVRRKGPGDLIQWKQVRRQFRTDIINKIGFQLTADQWAALEYVEGEHDYTPGKRGMNELCSVCHCCDILSARLWHDQGNGENWDLKQTAAA